MVDARKSVQVSNAKSSASGARPVEDRVKLQGSLPKGSFQCSAQAEVVITLESDLHPGHPVSDAEIEAIARLLGSDLDLLLKL